MDSGLRRNDNDVYFVRRTSCTRVQHIIFLGYTPLCFTLSSVIETEDIMNNQNFQTLQKTVANPHGTRKPHTGFYVQPIAFGSNAAATDIIRDERKSA